MNTRQQTQNNAFTFKQDPTSLGRNYIYWIAIAGLTSLSSLIAIIAFATFTLQFPNIIQDNNTLARIILSFFVLIYAVATTMVMMNVFRLARLVVDNRTSRLTNLNMQLELAASVARDASIASDMDQVIQSAVLLVHQRLDFYHVGIFLLNETYEYAQLHAVAGGEESQKLLSSTHKLKVGEQGIIGYVTRTGKPRVVMDVRQDSVYYNNPYLPETRSEMAVPLKLGNTVIGAIDVQSRKVGIFEKDQVHILEVLADLLAVTIEKARLYDVVQADAVKLQDRVNERTSELNYERAQLNAILDSMQEGVLYYEGDNITYTNQPFKRLLGYDEHTLTDFMDLLRLPDLSEQEVHRRFNKIFNHLLEHDHWQGELSVCTKSNKILQAHVTCVQVASEVISTDRTNQGLVIVVRDISQEKALQEQRARFVAYASHELRTPITNLKTRFYLLQKQQHRQTEHFDVINSVLQRMQQLVDDLLVQSRMESGRVTLRLKKQDLIPLIENVVKTQLPEANKKSIRLVFNSTQKSFELSIDQNRIEQVFTNLLSNSINYTGEGGEINVTTVFGEKYIGIQVMDNGVGIEEDLLPQLFQPFVRSENNNVKGTGLGLMITKQIIELHGGKITVDSQYGVGSTFTVYLPKKQVKFTSQNNVVRM